MAFILSVSDFLSVPCFAAPDRCQISAPLGSDIGVLIIQLSTPFHYAQIFKTGISKENSHRYDIMTEETSDYCSISGVSHHLLEQCRGIITNKH